MPRVFEARRENLSGFAKEGRGLSAGGRSRTGAGRGSAATTTTTRATCATATAGAEAAGAKTASTRATTKSSERVIIRVSREDFRRIRILGEQGLERLVQRRHFFRAGSVNRALGAEAAATKSAGAKATGATTATASATATATAGTGGTTRGRGASGRRGRRRRRRRRILGEHHRNCSQCAGCEQGR